MEQKSNVDFSKNQIEDSSGSPPQKKVKRQSEENSSQFEATGINTAKTDDHLSGSEHLKQQSTNSDDTHIKPPLKNGIFNFFLPLEEECIPSPEENLGPNSAGLKSSLTGGVWHKSLEESHSAQIRDGSLLGNLVCLEETQKKILVSDIFRILESEGVTEIGALYKVSPSKFVLVFRSKTAKEKLQGTEIQCRFGDSEICLNFCNRIGPARNGRAYLCDYSPS